MKHFYVNNSSLPYLNCSLQYSLTVGHELVRPPWGNTYTAIGLAFHELIQNAKPGESLALKGLLPADPKTKLGAIAPADRAKVALIAQRILDEHPEMYGPDAMRETWFDIPLDYPGEPVPRLCGTIDHRMIDPADGSLIITDYKTTKKPITEDLAVSYRLSFQRWFYIIGTLLDDTLPAQMLSAVNELKVKFRYCFVAYETNEYLLQPAELINVDELNAARRLLLDKVGLAQAIIRDPELAVPDGVMNNSCFTCPFKLICLSSAEDRPKHIENWYLGKKPYYPKHD